MVNVFAVPGNYLVLAKESLSDFICSLLYLFSRMSRNSYCVLSSSLLPIPELKG
jgi:hypothetical protein